jgi:hypothetical protein
MEFTENAAFQTLGADHVRIADYSPDLLELRFLNMRGARKAITIAAPTSRGSHGPPRVSHKASTTQRNAADSTYHLLRSLNRFLSPAGGGSGDALLKTR